MSRFDYDVLTWRAGASVELEGLREAYLSGRHEGIYLRVPRRCRLADLGFLEDLPDLRYLEVLGAISDDTYAFTIESLSELTLLTKCRVAIPDETGSMLEAIGVDYRPGLRNLSSSAGLRTLQVWNFDARTLADLPAAPKLVRLKIEGMRQDVSLAGIESCKSLADVEILEMRIESLLPLGELSGLRRLWLIGHSSSAPGRSLALADLSPAEGLEELRITYQGAVASAEPLLDFPQLHDVRLRGTSIADGNLEPLGVLAGRAVVVGPAD